MRLVPIVPTKPLTKANAEAAIAELRNWAARVASREAKYPRQQPTPYRRTGLLGRTWTFTVTRTGQDVTAEVGNNTHYASYVEGFKSQPPRQTAVMAGKGWPSVETVAQEEWKRSAPIIEAALQAI